LLSVEVAGDDEGGVVGDVVRVEEVLKLVDGRGLEVLHVADRRPAIAVADESVLEEILEDGAVRLVVAHAPLFGDDLALGFVDVLGDLEAGHAIGLEPQGHLEVLARERVHVDGFVKAGEGVGISADDADALHVLFGGDVGRPAEHHVLEHVRESLSVGPLIARADVIEDAHVHDGGLVQRGVDHVQAVGEGFFGEGDRGEVGLGTDTREKQNWDHGASLHSKLQSGRARQFFIGGPGRSARATVGHRNHAPLPEALQLRLHGRGGGDDDDGHLVRL
jgi:hypothetical protein